MSARILVVDDEPLKRISLRIELSEHGYEVFEAADAATARRIFDAEPIDVVVSDVRMPELSGLDLLTLFKRTRPQAEVILMTGYGTVESAVQAMKRGAHDYILKPFNTPELIEKLERLLAARAAAPRDAQVESFGRALTRNQSVRRLFERLRAAAATSRPVLLVGERGTGRRLLALAIHESSPRASGPLVGVDAAEPGQDSRAALAEALDRAAGGSLVLAGAEALPAALGATLAAAANVRLLGTVIRGTEPIGAGTIAAEIDVDSAAPAMRGLSPLVFPVPPLRERSDDVPLLARHFAEKHAALSGAKQPRLAPRTLDELLRYAWPGNVAELERTIERGLSCSDGGEVRPEHVLPLGDEGAPPPPMTLELSDAGPRGLTDTMSDIERRLILMALRNCEGNQARAAQRLGIPRTTLRDKMAKYNIPTS